MVNEYSGARFDGEQVTPAILGFCLHDQDSNAAKRERVPSTTLKGGVQNSHSCLNSRGAFPKDAEYGENSCL